MYPLLVQDPTRAAFIERAAKDLSALARENRSELSAAVRENRFPHEIYRELGSLGYLGALTSREWGGLGAGVAEYALINEETARHGLVSAQVAAQGQRWLLDWGTPEQQERWLRGIANGEIVFSESISEKYAGSSFKAMKATAVPDGSDWILTADKTHVNLGADSDVTLVYAMAPQGLTSFLVDTTLPGVTTRVTDAIGTRLIRTADVHLDGVRIRAEDVLGRPGGGMETFLSTFNVSRIGNASELIGLGRRALELGLEYAHRREVGSNVVTDFQGIQWATADSWTALHAAALARDHAALEYEACRDVSIATSVAKQLAVDAAEKASATAFSLCGGHALYHDQPFAEIDQEIKVYRVAGGSSEVLRNFVARRILEDPGHEGLA
ncbi:acyl-CoA/acyl-ACP dehydrogenase [Pseudonocardia kujensis]|uniref:acyl-CoA dehydrogenase family protein n=1 Tax=Pseudonocardia kujensis TaxID=1128675 RepID=UPI001E42C7BD|nr:acyl-CoA dehydrogenase family protein [Pseudonocardia kujensis]MCE0767805.1 acyl-CoA/acyl-ACP dehydrogenase [Pseudonocardia kujensis]